MKFCNLDRDEFIEIFCLFRFYQGAKQKGHGTPSAYVFLLLYITRNGVNFPLIFPLIPFLIFWATGSKVLGAFHHCIGSSFLSPNRGGQVCAVIPHTSLLIPPQYGTLSFCLASTQQLAANLDYFIFVIFCEW
jgi:hypothetical protein